MNNKDISIENNVDSVDESQKEPFNWRHEFSIRSIKIMDIAFICVIASIFSYIFSLGFNNIFSFNKDNYIKSCGKAKLGGMLLLEFALLGISFYIIRVIVRLVPFPLDGVKGWNAPPDFKGYDHCKLKEYNSPFVISLVMLLMLQDILKQKILFFTRLPN